MGAFPTIITDSPAVTVTTISSSLSYDQILYSLHQTAYYVKKIYFQANDTNQLIEPYTFTKPCADGTLYSVDKSPVVDMYQIQAILDGERGGFILDALTTFSFELNPNESLELIFHTDSVSFIYLEEDGPMPPIKYPTKRKYLRNQEVVAVSVLLTGAILILLKTTVIKK